MRDSAIGSVKVALTNRETPSASNLANIQNDIANLDKNRADPSYRSQLYLATEQIAEGTIIRSLNMRMRGRPSRDGSGVCRRLGVSFVAVDVFVLVFYVCAGGWEREGCPGDAEDARG